LQRAAAFTTLSQLPHAGRRTHAFIDRMVRRLPGLHLALGHDIATLPETIGSILRLDGAALDQLATSPGTARSAPARPLVSVIVPVYNGAGFLPHAVQCVLAQEYPAIEIIVVDDGSTDDVDKAVAALPVDVRYFRQENAGAASARNRAIRDASGELLAFLDVDDLWPERTLGSLVDLLAEHPDVDVVHGRAQVTRFTTHDEHGEYVGSPSEAFPYYIGAGVYRRRAFERVGLFDKELRFGEDTDWFTRAAERGLNILHLDEVTLLVRRHDGNMTRGKSLVELNPLRLFKKAIDRRRTELGIVVAEEAQ
jgi:glycosyltransferase involved in cell wall biosynthesis